MESLPLYYYQKAKEYQKKDPEKYLDYMMRYLSCQKVGISATNLFQMAQAYGKLNHKKEQETLLQIAIELNQNDVYCKTDLAKLLDEKGETKKAKALLEEVIQKTPEDLYAKELLAYIQRKEGDRLAEEENLRQMLKLNPEDRQTAQRLAQNLKKQGRLEEAETILQGLIQEENSKLEDKLDLASILIKKGNTTKDDRKKAISLAEEVLRKDPDNITAKLIIARGIGNIQQAEELLLQIRQTAPDNVKVGVKLANVYQKKGQYQEAKGVIAELMNYHPNNATLRVRMQWLTATQQEKKEDIVLYRYILDHMDSDLYNEERNRKDHAREIKTKRFHGVFTADREEFFKHIELEKGRKKEGKNCDIYCFDQPNCAYEGGTQGDHHSLNYITIITKPNTSEIINLFPSDETVKQKEREEEAR